VGVWGRGVQAVQGLSVFLPWGQKAPFYPVWIANFERVTLPGLVAYSYEYVIAWSAAEADKRPERGKLPKYLRGKQSLSGALETHKKRHWADQNNTAIRARILGLLPGHALNPPLFW
jgi:hypothetical protein